MKKTFEELMAIADHVALGENRLRDTILKEVLHADILMALQQSDLGKSLVFQGGTALRMCYGNPRYSEDLDFVRTAPLDPEMFETFKDLLKHSLADRYELNVRFADPKRPLDERTSEGTVVVHRWTATIEIDKPDIRNQKIHIEVADVPAYDGRPRMINSHYADYGGAPVLLRVSSEQEILADKVIAMAGRPYIKARDIWDIKWLRDKGIELNHDWVRKKAGDYHMVQGDDMTPLISRLETRVGELAQVETHQKFVEEMSRFLAKEQADLWLRDEMTTGGLLMDVGDFLESQLPKLQTPSEVASQYDSQDMATRIDAWRKSKGVRTKHTKKKGPSL